MSDDDQHGSGGFLERSSGSSEHGTNVRTEFIAGATTFLTMVYIVFVNPQILGKAGMDKGAVFVATCIASAVSTLVMALYANYPIALAPGMGLNAFFAFTVVLGYKYTWQQALAAVFCSGVLFFLISIFRIREYIINAIPKNLKLAISAGVGLFLGIIALEEAKIVVAHPATLVTLGDLKQWPAILCLLGFVLIAALNYRKVIGGTVIGILVVTRDRHSARACAIQRHRLGAAVARADAVPARFLAHRRADLHHRGVQLPAGRHLRQRRHADRRHPSRGPARQGRQPAAHAAGADRRQLRRHVRLADRHLDHDELYRERGRRLGRRAHRADRGVRRAVLPAGAVVLAARRHGAGLCDGGGAALCRLRDGAGARRDRMGRPHRIRARRWSPR